MNSGASGTLRSQTTYDYLIGKSAEANSEYMAGNIDDLFVFSRALTATEISNLYNTNIKKYMGVSNT